MKSLIINADDFGYTHSINLGIIEGIEADVITSTSLMVYGKYAKEVELIADNQNISIGLHFQVSEQQGKNQEEFYKQIELFEELVGRKPDHLDSHKIKPKDIPDLVKSIEKYSVENKAPVRDWGHAHFIESFFGLNLDGTGNLNLDKISPESLINICKTQVKDGYNELMCHAGYIDDELVKSSSYNQPREIELRSLVSNEFKAFISDSDINLVSWRDVRIG